MAHFGSRVQGITGQASPFSALNLARQRCGSA